MRIATQPLLTVLGLSALGCASSPYPGEWRSRDDVGGKENVLTFDGEPTSGTATLRAYIKGIDSVVAFSFDFDATERDKGVDLEMKCRKMSAAGYEPKTDCSVSDFRMHCSLHGNDES